MNKRLGALALGCFVAITGTAQAVTRSVLPVPTVQAPGVPELPSVPVPVVPVPVPEVDVPPPVVPVPVPEVDVPPPVVTAAPQVLAAPAPQVEGVATGSSGRSSVPAQPPSPGAASNAARVPGAAATTISRAVMGGSAGGSAGASAGAATPAAAERARREAARSRKLRRTVRRLRGCLAELPRFEARVLRLRAALDRRTPRSVARVARVVDRRERHVRRAERRGLRLLRAAARDGCRGGAVAPDGTGATSSFELGGAGIVSTVDVAASPSDGDDRGAGGRRSKQGRGGVLGAQAHRPRPPIAGVIPRSPERVALTIPLLVALAAVAWLLVRWLHGRRA